MGKGSFFIFAFFLFFFPRGLVAIGGGVVLAVLKSGVVFGVLHVGGRRTMFSIALRDMAVRMLGRLRTTSAVLSPCPFEEAARLG